MAVTPDAVTDPQGSGPSASGLADRQPVKFVLEVLRGVAQVDFMPSALCGVFFVAALFASGWQYGLYGLLGAAVGTATAYLLGIDRTLITAGLRGFNGCLVATAFAVFLGAGHLSTFLLAVAGSSLVVVVTSAVATFLGSWNLPTFTLPFCLVASVMTVAAPGFANVWHAGQGLAALPEAASGTTSLSWSDIWHAFLGNIGQIFFMPQWYVGLLFLAGIFVANRLAGVMACVGSATGLLVSWMLGAPAAGVAQGLMGYNAVLVAMALCGVFVAPSAVSFVYAVAGAGAATALTSAMNSFFGPFGGHTFTWPFVLTSIVFLAAVPAIPRLRRT